MHKLIVKQLKKNKISIIMFSTIFLISIVLLLIEPVVFGKILDMLLNNKGNINTEIIYNIVFLFFIVLSIFILNFIYRRIIFTTGRKIKQGIFTDILEKLEQAQTIFFEQTDKGTFVSYIINDINGLWTIIGHGLIELIRVIGYTVIGFIISMKYVNLSLTMSVFVTFPIFIYFIMKQNSKAQKLTYEIRDEEAELSKKINDGFCGFSVIKSYVNEEETIKQFDETNKNLKDKNIQYNKIISSINSIVTFCMGLGFAISCIYGLYLVTKNVITIGSFIAFNSIIQRIMGDYKYAGNLVIKSNQIKIINKRINFLYNINTNLQGKIDMPKNTDIHIRNLSFKYGSENENILENINMDIPNGSFIGILGKTGTGKTTFANILSKFYEAPNGTIVFNDIDINEIERKSFYENVAYVMQDDYIYDNTIKHNIELYKEYEEDDIIKSTQNAEFLSTIEKLDKKYETLIGENGIKLSGGQKQRLILSRNLLTKPSILIIDNGFTGLDLNTRKKVVENLTNKDEKTTLIIISSMLEDIKNADKIYVLDEKTIKEINVQEAYNA